MKTETEVALIFAFVEFCLNDNFIPNDEVTTLVLITLVVCSLYFRLTLKLITSSLLAMASLREHALQ